MPAPRPPRGTDSPASNPSPGGTPFIQVSGFRFQVFPLPWTFLAVSAIVLVIQLNPAWRDALLYDRTALGRGEFWRVWTGHLVHFGWPHYVADAGLLFILGWLLESRHPWFSRCGLLVMPAFISAIIWWGDAAMVRYGGLSAVNLGLLLYLALQGWQRNWTDWFWPAVLAIYVGEVIFEIVFRDHPGRPRRRHDPFRRPRHPCRDQRASGQRRLRLRRLAGGPPGQTPYGRIRRIAAPACFAYGWSAAGAS
ncbi:MAG: rhomboid family intramembrane serine protease [Opitutae bacterium]|nr:rhomboid family intramembrane serine protease [Opitutae bacterium]